ncbi:MAG: hypothetical protein IKD72_01365 [Clostridia bacterium]|nr:hypothetical protein [Clostridia bacterium]
MKLRRIVSLFMAAVLLSLALLIPANASAAAEPLNDAPFVFVHGYNGWGGAEGIDSALPYWGATTGSLMQFLQEEGYEAYSASVGPINSAWDRACELYAQLTGTTVDYGAAHAAAHHHARFGRTYEKPLFAGWGAEKQIHLIGHSFGGNTVRMFVQLLTAGDETERAATPAGELSGLFTGGKDDWVRSVTAICAPHQSSTVFYFVKPFGLISLMTSFSILYIGLVGRSFLNGRAVDFHMEQFGLSAVPGEKATVPLLQAMRNTYENFDDTCIYDLTPEGNEALNRYVTINPDLYYFSYAFSATREVPGLHTQIPMLGTNPIIAPLAAIIGMIRMTDPYNGTVYDDSWLPNDCMVNVESAKHPKYEPYTDYDPADVAPGVWNVMPVQPGDHGTAIGLLADKEQTHDFYIELCEMLNALPAEHGIPE